MTSIYDVLKASKGIHVDDTFAELWGRKLSNAYTVETYTGTLPTTLQTVEGYLENYKIYGNAVQDGTPTPENPITPSGCGEKTENLFDNPNDIDPYYIEPTEGKYSSTISNSRTALIKCTAGNVYTISAYSRTFRVAFYSNRPINETSALTFYNYDYGVYGTHVKTVTAPENAQYIGFFCYNSGTEAQTYTENEIFSTVMIVEGSTTPSTYVPYGYKLPILSNGVEYPIYLGEVEATRRIKKLVLTGSANDPIRKIGSNAPYAYYYEPTDMKGRDRRAIVCNHAPFSWNYSGETPAILMSRIFDTVYINLGKTTMDAQPSGNTIEGFKEFCAAQYAAGTPVTVWYVLAEPETGIVNEPLMKIGDYADTIDSTQSTAQIPTTANSTTISWAGEGLAPSEVELTYRKPKGQ